MVGMCKGCDMTRGWIQFNTTNNNDDDDKTIYKAP